jgi:Uma2 family endonuclease
VDEYYRMAGMGLFRDGERTELVDGEIVNFRSPSARHAAAVSRVSRSLAVMLETRALVRAELPVRLDLYNEPLPDIACVKVRSDFYEFRHPGAADISAIVEISETSLDYDRDVKLGIYAAVGIPEVWILDLPGTRLLVFRGPATGRYKTFLRLGSGDSVGMLAFPDMSFAVADLLGITTP